MPQIESVVQLTHDGRPKPSPGSLATDGSRIYFTEQVGGVFSLAQVSVVGGETVPIVTSLVNPRVLDIAPDSSALLVSYGTQDDKYIGRLPLPAGELRRIVKGETATFFPDGQRIAYCEGPSMYVAQADGSNAHKISDRGCYADFSLPLSISPDGSRIRFPVFENPGIPPNYWELNSSGGESKQVEPTAVGWSGKWTPDGLYFFFERYEHGTSNLWLHPEKHGVFSQASASLRFSNGPLGFDAPLPGRNGKTIFALGFQNRGELIRYDRGTKQFQPFLEGISATDAAYSADGKWLIYLTYPAHDLWRCRGDGKDCLQLTYPPMSAYWPHISRDTKQVQFLGHIPGMGDAQYVVDIAGGEPKNVNDSIFSAAWSYDDQSLLVSVPVDQTKLHNPDSYQLAVFNIESRNVSIIPGSQGKAGAFQPTPEMIVAGGPQDKLYWFDTRARKWSVLSDGPIASWILSPDSKYLYFVRETPGDPEALRFRFSDRKIESVASLRGLRRVADPVINGGLSMGVAPDGALLLTRDVGTQEIYAINLKWP